MEATSIITMLHQRASVRKFRLEDVAPEVVAQVVEAACHAPTSDSLQAYCIVEVREPATRARLAELAGNQKHVAVAPVVLVFCADLSKIALACAVLDQPFRANTLEMGLVAVVDAALVAMAASLASESLGIGSVMIGGLRNHPEAVAELLHLPSQTFAVFGLCLGWPAEPAPTKPRLPMSAIHFLESHHLPAVAPGIDKLDLLLGEHYRALGRSPVSRPWTSHAADLGANPRRRDLRVELGRLGFTFE